MALDPCGFSADGYTLAGDILGLGATMSIRGAFNASLIALVFGIVWIGEASAQSSLPPCASTRGVWNRCFGTRTSSTGKYVANFETASRMATMGDFDDASGREIFEKAFAVLERSLKVARKAGAVLRVR